MALIAVAAQAETAAPPSVLLAGANVPRAKALALDAALIKGWRVAVSERERVVFETRLETPASAGPPGVVLGKVAPPAQTLLRIRADFTATGDGVRTALRATETWYAGTRQQWSTDVTSPYRDNLLNALRSLREQWAAIAPQGAARAAAASDAGERRAKPRASATPARAEPSAAPSGSIAAPAQAARRVPESLRREHSAPPPEDLPVGVWAYHAEELAVSRGCELDERGAVLLREEDGAEVHRVDCRDGTSMLIRCDRERCRDSG
ncbi:hypothetical protein CKO31_10965 [Thiohalocapsa halophila]|uniref:Uncharacterized protein n=1 Tax=Thiohalocapsa halophila TaxID=69359 RepID=A0ABS1CH51_9GAMM|nr:hypothetical protein [Thiohalocapsa halophila]MBK1631250.1 hypothetical protein [Thiohalocapsa halophila]